MKQDLRCSRRQEPLRHSHTMALPCSNTTTALVVALVAVWLLPSRELSRMAAW